MSPPPVFLKTLRDLRWQVVGYGVGMALMAALVVYIFPSYSKQFADIEIPEALQGFIGDADYSSAEGFLSAEFFSFAPAVFVIFAVMTGTAALAGEEAAGTLEVLLAQPISRRRLAAEKIAGLLASACIIMALVYVGWLISVPFVDIDIGYLQLASATARIVPLVWLLQMMSMWLAAAISERRTATGLITIFSVASYIVAYLGGIVDVLAPLRWTSVFFYHDGVNALSSFDPAKFAVLIVLTVLFAFMAVKSFEAREIGVRGGITLPGLPRLFGRNNARPNDQPAARE